MAAGDIFQITDVQVLHGQGLANVWYLKVLDDTGTTDALVDAATAFDNQIITKIDDFQSNQLNHDCMLVRRVFPTTSPVEVVDVSRLGSKAAVSLPANQAVVLRRYSGNGDKQNRGRTYFAGVPESTQQQGRIKELDSTDYDALVAAAIDTITDSGRTYRLVNHSRVGGTFNDILEVEINPRLTKVRNRTPGICIIS